MKDKRILTIQDVSCVGQCSLTVALPILSACGVETCILPSAVLSTHTGGFKGFTFRDLTDDIPKIENHWRAEGITFDAVYTGYLGSAKQIDFVKDIMKRTLRPGGLKIVDPAMADNGKLYVGFDEAYVKCMKDLCGYADMILPNMTEACFLTGTEYRSEGHDASYIEGLLKKLGELGTGTVVLKGILDGKNRLGNAVYDVKSGKTEYYYTERIQKTSHGTGDCYASAFTGALMQGMTVFNAAKLAADFVVESILQTIGDDDHWYGVKFEKALPVLVQALNRPEMRSENAKLITERRTYVIDGNRFSNMEGFYDEVYRVMTKGKAWDSRTGHNLDSFNDVLRGGFGMHGYGEPIRIVWKNYDKSKEDLGAEKTGKILEIILRDGEDHDCLPVLCD